MAGMAERKIIVAKMTRTVKVPWVNGHAYQDEPKVRTCQTSPPDQATRDPGRECPGGRTGMPARAGRGDHEGARCTRAAHTPLPVSQARCACRNDAHTRLPSMASPASRCSSRHKYECSRRGPLRGPGTHSLPGTPGAREERTRRAWRYVVPWRTPGRAAGRVGAPTVPEKRAVLLRPVSGLPGRGRATARGRLSHTSGAG